MAVLGGSLVDEPFVSDLPRVALPFLDDDIEPLAVTRDESAPVIEFLTPEVKEYVSPAVTYKALSPVTEYVASTFAGMFDQLFPVDELAPFERVQQRTVDAPMPHILKKTVGVSELAPYERVQQQIVGMPMPQILKETVEVTDSVSPASAVTDTVPGLVTKNVAPTRAVTFDETAQ